MVKGTENAVSKLVKGMKATAAVGISYRYAAPEAFNRMYQRNGASAEEAKPVGE